MSDERKTNTLTEDERKDMADPVTFVGWLREVLIPDLEDSGHVATAEDFETAATLITDLVAELKQRDQYVRPAKPLIQLAREAMNVQDACNLIGVAQSFAHAMVDLRRNLMAASTDELNTHPIAVLWGDKIAHLTNTQALGHDRVMAAFRHVAHLLEREGLCACGAPATTFEDTAQRCIDCYRKEATDG